MNHENASSSHETSAQSKRPLILTVFSQASFFLLLGTRINLHLVYSVLRLGNYTEAIINHPGSQPWRFPEFKIEEAESMRVKPTTSGRLTGRDGSVVRAQIHWRKVYGLNPTYVYRLPLSKLGQLGSIPALVLPLGGVAARPRKGVKTERLS
ncbi:hypothetical protein CSKR_102016 [Clonorchis sinensis]|uniref:Uncharacterized protein n=1 Tax=Clonorchis sinensis TaxID=79923 RepID=A0A419QBT3_CLOSI|nr:hypothetical protein CSKR_102016 [Clonorchis sinensis]